MSASPEIDLNDASAERLRAAGLRRTRALQAVLGLFEAEPTWSPSHAELVERLAAQGEAMNAVTLYRLLERLVSAGLLARRTATGERVWRFHWLSAPEEAGPLFECDACHHQFPLAEDDAAARAVAAALGRLLARQGHHAERVDLAVHGTCADCRGVGAPA